MTMSTRGELGRKLVEAAHLSGRFLLRSGAYPDTYFDDRVTITAGAMKFECHHARGETDDHCWVYIPQRKVLCTGDFIIWAAPNAGNPQKVQRYAREWSEALRTMAKTGAEILIPGHGLPVFGPMRVRQVLLARRDQFVNTVSEKLMVYALGRPVGANRG